MRNFIRGAFRRLLSPLFLDQMASSGSNVLLVLVAARSMSPEQFAPFATIQLINTTLMGVGRLAIYGPALSAQRTSGRLRIPAGWVIWVCIALTTVSSPLIAWLLVRSTQAGPLQIAITCMAPIVVFAQDGLRYARMSEFRIGVVLASDLVWLCITLPLVAINGETVSHAYSAWLIGALLGLLVLIPQKAKALPAVTFRAAWSMGRWGLADSLLAAFIIAGPTVAAGFFDQSLVPVYRVVQSAVSPMNLANSVLVISFGLNAWQLHMVDGVDNIVAKVRKATITLVVLAVALSTLGIALALWFAEIGWSDAAEPWLIVACATITGGWMSARQAASQSLGMQHVGAAVRLLSGLYAAAVILLAARTNLLHDPIGVTIAGATIISLIGSQLAFRRGILNLLAIREGGLTASH